MGNAALGGAGVAGGGGSDPGDGSGEQPQRSRLKDAILLRSFRAVDFTEVPLELREHCGGGGGGDDGGDDDSSSGGAAGEPQWALMSALVERHTTQLELRHKYAALERELNATYDAQDAADAEFFDALVGVGETAQGAQSPQTVAEQAQRLLNDAAEEAELERVRTEIERESRREHMQRRLLARKKSQHIRALRSQALGRHTRKKAELWGAVRNVSRTLQRGFHATHHHAAAGGKGGAVQKQLEGVDLQLFDLRKKQAELAAARRAAAREEERAARVLRNDLAIAEQRLQAAKAREAEARLRLEAAGTHKHAAWVAQKAVEKAQADQRDASVSIADLRFQVQSQEQATADANQAFRAEEKRLQQELVELMRAKAAEVAGKMDEGAHWVEQSDSAGTCYYWNWRTGESRWEKPPELLLADEVHRNRAWKQVVHVHLAAVVGLGPVDAAAAGNETSKRRRPGRKQHTTLERYMSLCDEISAEKYYYDNLTGATSWDDPRVAVAARAAESESEAAGWAVGDSVRSDGGGAGQLAERVRAVEGEVGDDDRWYYELTRSMLRRRPAPAGGGGGDGDGSGDGGAVAAADSDDDAAEGLGNQLVRIEWLNLEETTIFQLELDICSIEAEIARVAENDTVALLDMLEELDDGSPLDEKDDEGRDSGDRPEVSRTTSQVQHQVFDDFMRQEEAASEAVRTKAAMEKRELEERVRQQKHRKQQGAAAAAAAATAAAVAGL